MLAENEEDVTEEQGKEEPVDAVAFNVSISVQCGGNSAVGWGMLYSAMAFMKLFFAGQFDVTQIKAVGDES